jgi:uncharacterized integral membrane protein
MRNSDEFGPSEDPGGRSRGSLEPPPSGIKPRTVIIVFVAIVLVAFGIANFKTVEVNFLAFTSQARLVTVIVVAAALGFVIGYFVGRPTRAQRKFLKDRDRDTDRD